MTKTCTKCGEAKPVDAYGKNSRKPDGLQPWCKDCRNADARRRTTPAHQERTCLLLLGQRRCPDCEKVKPLSEFSSDKRRAAGVQTYCRECCSRRYMDARADPEWVDNRNTQARANRAANRDERNRKARERRRWRWQNDPGYRNRSLMRSREWKRRNDESQSEYRREYARRPEVVARRSVKYRDKYHSDARYRLSMVMGSAIYQAVSGNKNRRAWESLVGYTTEDLMAHLESRFTDGMSWDSYGKYGWHIDHIVPISAFNYDSPDHIDFRRCWSLGNLRPLWAKENLQKGAKLGAPFQPALRLAVDVACVVN